MVNIMKKTGLDAGERRLDARAVETHALPSRTSLRMRRECKPELAFHRHTRTASKWPEFLIPVDLQFTFPFQKRRDKVLAI